MVTFNQKLINNYIDKLIGDFDKYKKYYSSVISIYIGGGTPNMLDDYILERLLKAIDNLKINALEYTIEINPELLTLNQVLLFKKYGINRVSIGAESLNDDHLKFLGRHHKKIDILNSLNLLRENGITNINLDFIYAHPMDNKILLNDMLEEAIALKIPHFSFYTLILEENTIFSHKKLKMLNDDEISDLMDLVNDKLNMYHHYEISNYAIKGFESIHNSLYWTCNEYIGIGMGASGYLDGIRYDNPKKISDYINDIKPDLNKLSIFDMKSEYFILGLRLLDGVSIKKYQNIFKSKIEDDFNIDEMLKYNLLKIDGDILRLTYKGYKLGNVVFEVFLWEKSI